MKVFVHIGHFGKYFDEEVVEKNEVRVEVYDNQQKTMVTIGNQCFTVDGAFDVDDVEFSY